MKETSIEWLATMLYNKMEMRGDGNVFQEIFEQAKEKHKEEIIEAYKAGEKEEPRTILSRINRDAEQYFNETFKSE